ncbi:insulin-like growth factor-binding protein 3 isoform X2 [Rhinoderma darwinii]|uniref:insulin-like growth factor-binding protein 3 isoform X2 n=1 Tax=Rhinoderma darwinii TaxID=43563 RepID=UPI003F678073
MLSSLYVLCVAALWLSQLAVAVGPVVQCEACDSQALEQCKPLSPDCGEFVQEPLCGCCWTCALTEGSQCGVYSQKCSSGLKCRTGPEEQRPLHALLMGRGICVNVTAGKQQRHSLGGNYSKSDEDMLPDTRDTQAPSHSQRILYSNPQTKIEIIRKEQARNTQRYKVNYDPQSTDTLNYFSESKQDMEHCHPSKGRKRGNCWCVDKYGQPLHGYDVNNKGDANCYNLESK